VDRLDLLDLQVLKGNRDQLVNLVQQALLDQLVYLGPLGQLGRPDFKEQLVQSDLRVQLVIKEILVALEQLVRLAWRDLPDQQV